MAAPYFWFESGLNMHRKKVPLSIKSEKSLPNSSSQNKSPAFFTQVEVRLRHAVLARKSIHLNKYTIFDMVQNKENHLYSYREGKMARIGFVQNKRHPSRAIPLLQIVKEILIFLNQVLFLKFLKNNTGKTG